MYTKPIIYKVYSVMVLAFAIIGFFGSLTNMFTLPSHISFMPFFDNFLMLFKVSLIIISLISIFFAYMDFSSMYTFAEMIEYELQNKTEAFKKKGFVLPANSYRAFGSIVYILYFIVSIVSVISLIAAIIIIAVTSGVFLFFNIIPIIFIGVNTFLIYITYKCKYKVFADVLNVIEKEKRDPADIERLKENKTGLLRGYCTFLFVISLIFVAAIVIAMVLLSSLPFITALIFDILLVIYGIIMFIILAIQGCFFDNLAKMNEHYVLLTQRIQRF